MQRLFLFLGLTAVFVAVPLRAESYVIADHQTGRILEDGAANRKAQIASLTKLALAMVALDWAEI